MSLLGEHHGRTLGGRDAGDPLPRPHARRSRQLLDPRPVRRAEDELVGTLVVEVDEARVRPQRVGDLARDELEHLLQVERRVDRGDGLGEEAEMTCCRVHAPIVVSTGRTCHRICRRVVRRLDPRAPPAQRVRVRRGHGRVLGAHLRGSRVATLDRLWVLVVAVRRTDARTGRSAWSRRQDRRRGGRDRSGRRSSSSASGSRSRSADTTSGMAWIIAALVLWAIAGALGGRTGEGVHGRDEQGAGAAKPPAQTGPNAELLALNRTQSGVVLHTVVASSSCSDPHRHDLETGRMSALARRCAARRAGTSRCSCTSSAR